MAPQPHAIPMAAKGPHGPRRKGQHFYKKSMPIIDRPFMQEKLVFGPFSIENGLLPDKLRALSALTPKQRDAIANYTKEIAKEPVKTEAFARFAIYLASWAGADKEVCWVAAILRGNWNGSALGGQAPNQGSNAKNFLLSLSLPRDFIKKVEDAITASNSERPPREFAEGKVLWEAVNISKVRKGHEECENAPAIGSFTIWPLLSAINPAKA